MSTSETPPLFFLLPPCFLSSSSSWLPLAKAGAAPNPSASAPPPSSFAEPLKKVRRELRRWCASEGSSSCSGVAVSMWLSPLSMHRSFFLVVGFRTTPMGVYHPSLVSLRLLQSPFLSLLRPPEPP